MSQTNEHFILGNPFPVATSTGGCIDDQPAVDRTAAAAPVIVRDESISDAESAISERPDEVPDFELVCLKDVVSEPIDWLWPNRIARGSITILAGDPGLGKSTVSLDIASTVSTGRPWPDAPDVRSEPGSVILLCAEDGLANTVKPRTEAAQGDVSKIHVLKTVKGPDGTLGPFNLKTDVPRLEAAVRMAADTRLVIIDPVSCYLGNTDDNKNAAVRGLLAPLAEMAERLGVAVVLVTHLNKNAAGKSAYRVMGSLGFSAAARAVWMIQLDPEDPGRVLMVQSKLNIAARQKGLAFRLDEGKVKWEAEPVDLTADDLAAAESEPPVRVKEIDRAISFVRDMLASGPEATNDLMDRGRQMDFSERTLKRAKSALGVRSEKSRDPEDARWYCRLPTTVPISVEGSQRVTTGTNGPLGRLPEGEDESGELEESHYLYKF